MKQCICHPCSIHKGAITSGYPTEGNLTLREHENIVAHTVEMIRYNLEQGNPSILAPIFHQFRTLTQDETK